MTIYVNETKLDVEVAFNQPNLEFGDYEFIITSQYSHQDEVLVPTELLSSNSRWSLFKVQFPTGFGDSHLNGVYWYELKYGATTLEKGLVKIITNPGGEINTLAYNSGITTEERVSDVYFRPNY